MIRALPQFVHWAEKLEKVSVSKSIRAKQYQKLVDVHFECCMSTVFLVTVVLAQGPASVQKLDNDSVNFYTDDMVAIIGASMDLWQVYRRATGAIMRLAGNELSAISPRHQN